MNGVQLFAVTADGPLALPLPAGATGCHDVFESLPQGVYSGLRSYRNHCFLRLEDHLERTQQSIDLSGWDFVLDRSAIRRCLDAACRAHPGDVRIRFDCLPTPVPALGTESRVLFALAPLDAPPASLREDGIRVQLTRDLERCDPLIKKSDFVLRRKPLPLGTGEAYEHLLVDSGGKLLEGSSSNFFGVRAGRLQTAGEGVLEGITRKIVLELAEASDLPVRLEPVAESEVPQLDEAFLTSSTRHLLPVVSIADTRIGDGRPGPVTRALMAAYDAYVEREARPAVSTVEGDALTRP